MSYILHIRWSHLHKVFQIQNFCDCVNGILLVRPSRIKGAIILKRSNLKWNVDRYFQGGERNSIEDTYGGRTNATKGTIEGKLSDWNPHTLNYSIKCMKLQNKGSTEKGHIKALIRDAKMFKVKRTINYHKCTQHTSLNHNAELHLAAKITQPQDPLTISNNNDLNTHLRPVSQNLQDLPSAQELSFNKNNKKV